MTHGDYKFRVAQYLLCLYEPGAAYSITLQKCRIMIDYPLDGLDLDLSQKRDNGVTQKGL